MLCTIIQNSLKLYDSYKEPEMKQTFKIAWLRLVRHLTRIEDTEIKKRCGKGNTDRSNQDGAMVLFREG